jgi:D-alanyl-lipoteichoic acid acyltransferase DltB (MBOAT superfamily)
MIPEYDSFDWFASLLPLLVLLVPAMLIARVGGWRRAILSVAGLYLLALVAPRLAVVHLALWAVTAALQPVVAATGERRSGPWVLGASLAGVLAPMVAWKVWPVEFVIRMNEWPNAVLRVSDLAEAIDFTAPIVAAIGLSFSSFRAADLLVKSNLGLVDRLSPGRVLAYGVFPPLLVVGPIASYDEVALMLERPVPLDAKRFTAGAAQILTGLFKVFVVAYALGWSGATFDVFDTNEVWRLWVGLVAFTLFFYVNFAGYSDLAIGASRLLGADLRPNFDSPYLRTDPAGFWNSWHMSLTRFLRANVFTPLVGRHPGRQPAATMLTMLLIGLWHSVTWASAAFGIYHGVSLVVHRQLQRRRPARQGPALRVLKPAAVFAWFALSLPLLQLDLGGAIEFYAALVGLG